MDRKAWIVVTLCGILLAFGMYQSAENGKLLREKHAAEQKIKDAAEAEAKKNNPDDEVLTRSKKDTTKSPIKRPTPSPTKEPPRTISKPPKLGPPSLTGQATTTASPSP